MQVGIDAKVIIPIGISSTRRSKSSHCAKCYTNQKQMLSLPQVSKDAKLELLKKICHRKVKQNFRRWAKKEKLFNKRTSFFWRKAATDAFFITTKSQTVCVDNFVKERRFRKPIISLGTFYNWSVKVLSVFPAWNSIEKFPSLASPFVRRQPSENSRNFAKKKSNLWSVVCLTLATSFGKLLRRKKKIFVCGCE